VTAIGVLFIALGTAVATGLGVLPVLAVRRESLPSIVVANSVAAGFMLGATVGLIYEGSVRNGLETFVGTAAGALFIVLTRRFIGRSRDAHIGNLKGARGLTAVLVIGVMTVHSMAEGVAVGVSLAGEQSLGLLIAVALAVHNIPEGVAISLALVPFGVSAWRAAGWSVFSSLPQPLLAVPAFLAVRVFEPVLAAGLGFAAGAMVWMVFAKLVPESLKSPSRGLSLGTLASSTALMVALEAALVL
jgi:zinc transporter, ZIP family